MKLSEILIISFMIFLFLITFLPISIFSGHNTPLYNEKIIGYIADLGIPLFAIIISIFTMRKTAKQNKQSSFNEKFSLLLEQHNKYHDELIISLKDEVSKEDKDILLHSDNYKTSNNKLYMNAIFSPYMRVLYHILKTINSEFGNEYKKAKQYTSLLRSVIRNDILYYVAINSLSDDNTSFSGYRFLLKKYDFFEHLSFTDTRYLNPDKKERFSLDKDVESVKNKLQSILYNVVDRHLALQYNVKMGVDDNQHLYSPVLNIPSLYKFHLCFRPNDLKNHSEDIISHTLDILQKNNVINLMKNKREGIKYKNLKFISNIVPYSVYSKYKKYKLLSENKGYLDTRKPLLYFTTKYFSFLQQLNVVIKNKENSNAFVNRIYTESGLSQHGKIKIKITSHKVVFYEGWGFRHEETEYLSSIHYEITKEIKNNLIESEIRKGDILSILHSKYFSSIDNVVFFKEQESLFKEIKNKIVEQ